MPTPPTDRLAARRRRASNLRRRVVAGALATFALAWGVIAYDGSMGAEATTTASTGATASATTASDDTITTAQS